jgi:DNA polymerase V
MQESVNVPVDAGITTGTGETEAMELVQLLQIHPGRCHVMKMKGNSMQDAHIPDGACLIVDRSIRPASGAIVAAMLDNEVTVKRWVKAGRHWVLHAENSFYKPVVITEEMDFRILGVVTHVILALCR